MLGQVLVGGEVVEEAGARLPLAAFRALAAREPQAVEEELAELPRRAEIELVADEAVDLLLEPREALGERARETGKNGAVDEDARVLHADDHRNERALEALVDGAQVLGGEARLELEP